MKSRVCTFALMASIFWHLPAHAQGIPVYDAASYGQFLTQLNQMSQDYQKQIEQLNEAVKQTNALTGTRGMGTVANGSLESDLRRYLPNTWQDTMNIMNAPGLGTAGLNTQTKFNSLYSAFAPVKGADFIPSDPTGSAAQAVDRSTTTTYAAMAAGEEAFDSVPHRMETYESLLQELDNTSDLKGSIDLLARISAENGFVLNEMMRLNAVQIQQKAAQDNQTLSDYKRSFTANQYNPETAANAFKTGDNP